MLSAAWSAILPDATFEQVLLKIDSALLYTKQYEAELEVRIANLKSLQQHASSYEERYNICRQLVECYENYRADSTYHYIDCCKEMAVKVGLAGLSELVSDRCVFADEYAGYGQRRTKKDG